MRYILTLIAALLLSVPAFGQGIARFKSSLTSSNTMSGARIVIDEKGDAADIIKAVKTPYAGRKVNGYRVRIFFDNAQDARQKASVARARLNELFPDVSSYMNYENPYFEVTAGNCLTQEEAVILWGKLKSSFDKAFITRVEIPLSVFFD